MGNWLEKFLSFDRMMGEDLIRKTYYFGLLLIGGWAVLTLLRALIILFSNFSLAVSLIITTPLMALFALMIWRIIAERLLLGWEAVETETGMPEEDAPIQGEVVGAGAAADEPQDEVVDVEFDLAEETVEIVEEVVEVEPDTAEAELAQDEAEPTEDSAEPESEDAAEDAAEVVESEAEKTIDDADETEEVSSEDDVEESEISEEDSETRP